MKSTYNFTILFALYNTLNDWVLTHQFHYFTDFPQPCMFPLQETYSWCLAWQTFACLQDFALSLSYLDIPILHLYNRNILATPSKILFYRLKALLSLSVWYKTHVSFYMENSWSQNLFTQNWVDRQPIDWTCVIVYIPSWVRGARFFLVGSKIRLKSAEWRTLKTSTLEAKTKKEGATEHW